MFYKFKKGSPEAKAHMAKLRAMVGKKKRKNPLTPKEAAEVRRRAKKSAELATHMKPHSYARGFFTGMASGREDVARDFGPKRRKKNDATEDRRKAIEASVQARSKAMKRRSSRPKCPFCGSETDFLPDGSCRYCGKGGRKRNAPLLILGNPGKNRRKFRRPKASSFGECPKGFPSAIWKDPEFQRERRIFISRHGANVPIHIQKVNMPPGSPRFMTAYGRAQHAVYDAPKQRRNGTKFIHKFGKKGKNKPFLVSSASKGPKWLGYAGGTFKAKTRWLYD